jgi:hypothetical protein
VFDAKRARVGERVRLYVDLEASRGWPRAHYRFAPPHGRRASELLKRWSVNVTELGRDIEERRKREPSVLELWMGHAKLGRLVPPALIPQYVEVDAAGTPACVGNAMTPETTLDAKQDVQQVGW